MVSDTIIVGTPLKRLPQFQAQAGFNYTRPVYNYGDAFIGADVSWAGDYNITSDPYGRFQTGAIFERPDQALVSAQVGFETADDRVRVVAECSNCTDQQYFTNTLSGFFYPARGIDYGLRLELKY